MRNPRSKVSEAPVVMSIRMIRGDHHHQCSVWIIVGNYCLLIEDHYHFNYRLMTLGQDAVYFRLIPHKAQPSPCWCWCCQVLWGSNIFIMLSFLSKQRAQKEELSSLRLRGFNLLKTSLDWNQMMQKNS